LKGRNAGGTTKIEVVGVDSSRKKKKKPFISGLVAESPHPGSKKRKNPFGRKRFGAEKKGVRGLGASLSGRNTPPERE